MVLVMSAFSFLTRYPPASSGRGYGVLWLVRAETGGSSETALLLLTLRWNEKSRGLRVMGVRRVLDKPRGSSLGTLAAVLVLSGAAWYGAERGCD